MKLHNLVLLTCAGNERDILKDTYRIKGRVLFLELKDKCRVPLHDSFPFQVSRSFDGAGSKGKGQKLIKLRIRVCLKESRNGSSCTFYFLECVRRNRHLCDKNAFVSSS